MSRLLILSCSQRKRSCPDLLPAIERYDGPVFRVLRKYQRDEGGHLPQTLVLSARYGLISGDRLIPEYDQRMTEQKAQEIKPQVRDSLGEILEAGSYKEAMVCGGQRYLAALGISEDKPFDFPVQVVSGAMGKQVAALYDWLRGEAPGMKPIDASSRPVVFRGVEIRRSVKQVLELAQKQASEDPVGASRYYAWYVQAGEQRVAPKWLLNVITNIPVSAFTTSEARSTLARLGIEVFRA